MTTIGQPPTWDSSRATKGLCLSRCQLRAERPRGSVLSIGPRAFPAYPVSVLRPALHVTYLPQGCTVWKVPKAPAELRSATPSTIPTLLLAGSFDGITPTSWARIAARTLPNSTLAEFARIGHFVTLASPCAQQVFASFLATSSTPNTACVAAVTPPRFAPRTTSARLTGR